MNEDIEFLKQKIADLEQKRLIQLANVDLSRKYFLKSQAEFEREQTRLNDLEALIYELKQGQLSLGDV